MGANTITTISRRRRSARRRRILALALGVCALAIPARASADPASSDYSRADAIAAGLEESSQPAGGSDYSSLNSITGGSSEPSAVSGSPHGVSYSSLNAIAGPPPASEPTLASRPSGADDGFDWASAAIGAAAAMALVALGGAMLLTVRRRTAVSPSAASMS
jgi:hypothetical protein